MDNFTGVILQSTPAMDDPVFMNTHVLVTAHNDEGATGFIINRLLPRRLNALVEFSRSKAFPLYKGGPAGTESLFLIHQRPDLIEGGTHITGMLYFGGNFSQALAHINGNTIREDKIRLFIGYCGWNDNELAAEIEEGSWIVTEKADSNILKGS